MQFKNKNWFLFLLSLVIIISSFEVARVIATTHPLFNIIYVGPIILIIEIATQINSKINSTIEKNKNVAIFILGLSWFTHYIVFFGTFDFYPFTMLYLLFWAAYLILILGFIKKKRFGYLLITIIFFLLSLLYPRILYSIYYPEFSYILISVSLFYLNHGWFKNSRLRIVTPSILAILVTIVVFQNANYIDKFNEFYANITGKKIIVKQIFIGESEANLNYPIPISDYSTDVVRSRCKDIETSPENCTYIKWVENEFVDSSESEFMCWNCRYWIVDCYYACPKDYSEEMNLKSPSGILIPSPLGEGFSNFEALQRKI